MPQDVSVKDISTIRVFANALNHFCADYASKLQNVGRQATSDSGNAHFRLHRFEFDLHDAEVKLRHASSEMEYLERSESASPREYDDARKKLESAQMDYDRKKELLERAQQLVKELETQFKQVEDITYSMGRQLNDAAYNASTAISTALNKIQAYAK